MNSEKDHNKMNKKEHSEDRYEHHHNHEESREQNTKHHIGGNHDHQHNEHSGHDHSEHHRLMIKDFRKRFWISLIITVPILVLSPLIQNALGYTLEFGLSKYLLFAFSAVIYFYGGWPFITGLVSEIKKKQPGMMTLIAVAITVAFAYSTATTFGLKGNSFFWELATLIDIMLLGHWIEMKSVVNASGALQSLVELMPDKAHRWEDNDTTEVKITELKAGDMVLVRPAEKIPVDGVIVDGKSNINESMVTGESKPVEKAHDDKVIGGTINEKSSIKVKAEGVGEDAYLSKVIHMVREAQNKKSKSQRLADKIAFWLTIAALVIGFGTLATWLVVGKPLVFALERMASVMVITCPHALGLAVPLVVAISTSISAKQGLLIRNRTAFENARKISVMVFDKTGTLTKGNFGVSKVKSFSDQLTDKEILKLGASLESQSEHPLGEGILKKAEEEKLKWQEPKDFETITGKGIKGKIDGKSIKVVSPGYLKENNIEIPEEYDFDTEETVVFVLKEEKPIGFISLADEIREEAYEAVETLKNNDLKLMMMTGDNEKVAKSVSEKLGLNKYFAGLLPDQKLEKIKELQENGEFVCMTGDGINDAPALATADVGIAVGSGTDVAAETADIILVNSNPNDVSSLVVFGKETYKKMIQNFIWATGYNVVAIPLAAGVLIGAGIIISPALGAVLMSLSTVIVAINAQLLKRKMHTGYTNSISK